MIAALERVTQLRIPRSVARHYHVREAFVVANSLHRNRERIIGTTNNAGPVTELYGWAPMVEKHADCTGFVYFMPLKLPRTGSIVYAGDRQFAIKVGDVYRLNDHAPHGTYEDGAVVCMFRGPYLDPADDEAIWEFGSGLSKLEARASDAPRVKDGFRFKQPDECWANTDKGTVLVKIAEARAKDLLIATCAVCGALAFTVDHHFPYHWEGNACLKHAPKD